MTKNESRCFDSGRVNKIEKKRARWDTYWLSEYRRWLKLGVTDELSTDVAKVTSFLIGLRARKKQAWQRNQAFRP